VTDNTSVFDQTATYWCTVRSPEVTDNEANVFDQIRKVFFPSISSAAEDLKKTRSL